MLGFTLGGVSGSSGLVGVRYPPDTCVCICNNNRRVGSLQQVGERSVTKMWTYVDVLTHLAQDEVLHTWLADQGLEVPLQPSEGCEAVAPAVVQAVQTLENSQVRERIIAGLQRGAQLAHPLGRDAMFEAAATHGDVFLALVRCKSDLHRSFWLYVCYRAIFDQSCAAEYLDANVARAQQHDLGCKVVPRRDAEALQALCAEVGAFYRQQFGCGDRCVAQLFERSNDVFVLTLHVKDLPNLLLEFDGDAVRQRIGHPTIHIVLEYAPRTGATRSLVRGGAKFHHMLVNAFARHLLECDVDAQRVLRPRLNLSPLRDGFRVPRAIEDGFSVVQVKSLSLISPAGTLKLECSATAAGGRRSVTELLKEMWCEDHPLTDGWRITAADIALYYPPEPGRSRMRQICLEITDRGRVNLHKFEASLQRQLESYLIDMGILRPEQTFEAPSLPTGMPEHTVEPSP
ncbi:hypothetical protein OOT46_00095 [Aquabacterium sp. A7-Y]|uniref:hypothetical protein n=1 Tax=Aquabacterium sp. A7-Y TaxID=1349605 RepID=UPI00223CEE39|nr:hypothetical protein [Aquabacterium sp. A7-Y]MCW7536254.1 hypothetical protein [Aquabacterium sp. A7-Y]